MASIRAALPAGVRLNGDFRKLLRQANDIVGQVLLVVFFAIMCAVPLTVLVLGIINFVRALSRRGTIVLQALISLVLWTVLTYAIVLIFFMIVFSQKYPVSTPDELKTTAIFILATVIYAAAGAALIYWTKRQAKLSQAA